jgi:hypothetical protein
MNRLVSFIGYNPKGCQTSNALFTFDNTDQKCTNVIIPKYAYIDTKLTDLNGNPIYFSTIENEQISTNS